MRAAKQAGRAARGRRGAARPRAARVRRLPGARSVRSVWTARPRRSPATRCAAARGRQVRDCSPAAAPRNSLRPSTARGCRTVRDRQELPPPPTALTSDRRRRRGRGAADYGLRSRAACRCDQRQQRRLDDWARERGRERERGRGGGRVGQAVGNGRRDCHWAAGRCDQRQLICDRLRGPGAARNAPPSPLARAAAAVTAGLPAAKPRARLLSSELEMQAEILSHRRYTVITERYCMTHSDTGHQNSTVKSCCDSRSSV